MRRAVDTGDLPDYVVPLRTQYRMHPQISAIPNALIYDGLLEDDPSTLDDSELDGWFDRTWGPDAPVVLVDTESLHAWVTGVGGAGRTSRLNFLSATVCADLASACCVTSGLLSKTAHRGECSSPPRIVHMRNWSSCSCATSSSSARWWPSCTHIPGQRGAGRHLRPCQRPAALARRDVRSRLR